MKRPLIVMALLAGSVLLAAPAGAGTEECSRAVAEFVAEFPEIYADAGSPEITCTGRTGRVLTAVSLTATDTIELPEAPPVSMRSLIAHEIGHHWRSEQVTDLRRYAKIRGHEWNYTVLGAVLVSEDYAETFAWALGWWGRDEGVSSPPPYGFQTPAGVPTESQIRKLIRRGLLPRR